MKKLLAIGTLLLTVNGLFAQTLNYVPKWNGSAYSNTVTPIFEDATNSRIGIGTTSPAYRLDVSSSAVTTVQIGTTSSTGNPNLIFKGSLGYWKVSKSVSAGGSSAPSSLDFTYNTAVYGGDHPIMSMYYNGSGTGCVVIGTNTTSILGGCVLGVEGKIGARELIISNTSPFPDYVFKTGYKLRSLPELEAYIKLHSHLPGVPTAEEIKKNGLEVGSMTTTLLQKVEELTLQMIEMNKKIEMLEKANGQLKAQIKALN